MSYRVKFRPVGTKLPFTATLHENSISNPPVLTKTVTSSNNVEYFESDGVYTISPYETYCVKVVDAINTQVEVCDVDYPNYVLTIEPDGFVTFDYEIMGSGTNGTTNMNIDVPFNEVVRLEAFPNTNYEFLKWTTINGDVTSNPYIFNMPNNDITIGCLTEEVINNSIQFVIDTNLGASSTFGLPLSTSNNYNFIVDWGDGNTQTVVATAPLVPVVEHTYAANGVFVVTLTGNIGGLTSSVLAHRSKITEFHILGDVGLTTIRNTFSFCNNLTTFTTYNGGWCQNITDMYQLFAGCSSLVNIDVSNWNVSNVTDFSYMFSGCSILTNLNVTNWNVGSANNMAYMFNECGLLNNLELTNWNVSGVTNMEYMFCKCHALTNINVNSWDVSSVTNMMFMFSKCDHIASFTNISNWNVGNVTNMNSMFSFCLMSSINLNGWNVNNVTSMDSMFSNCTNLSSIDLNLWVPTALTTTDSMFSLCSSLLYANLGGWVAANLTNLNNMFESCTSMTSISIDNWSLGATASMVDMFAGVTLMPLAYTNFLSNIESMATVPSNVTFDAPLCQYTCNTPGADARLVLIMDYNWNIDDNGCISL